ncbi:MAG TPA: nitronate monooxygenase [Chloroflexia bacterium]|nr:nitronate monooxygenase [Chloroflexia bacterium]
MWTETKITRTLKIAYPIIQGPMAGGPTTPALVAAVSNGGGLGSLGAAYLTPDQMRKDIREIRSLTAKPFGVNLFIPGPAQAQPQAIERMQQILATYRRELGLETPEIKAPYIPSFEEQIQVALEERVPVFSFTFGLLPARWVQEMKAAGIVVMGTATTVQEGIALEKSGVDGIVGQGSEAGGHRGTFLAPVPQSLIGTMALIPQLVDAVKIPVVAAGGIMDGRGIAAALTLGADAVQLGTAFLATPESGAHPDYKTLLQKSPEDSTTLTRVFSGRYARGLRNRFTEELQDHEAELLPFPIQNSYTRDIRTAANKQNRTEFMSLWAGQGVRLTRALPAAELVAELAKEVNAALNKVQAQ